MVNSSLGATHMFRYAIPFVCLMTLSISGCGPKKPVVQVATVKGQVKLDDKPMEEGEILFVVQGQIPRTLPIKAGAYSGEVVAGPSRVEIRAYKDAAPIMMGDQIANKGSKENYIPAKFNSESTLTADMSGGGAKEFNYDVTSN